MNCSKHGSFQSQSKCSVCIEEEIILPFVIPQEMQTGFESKVMDKINILIKEVRELRKLIQS